MSDEARWRKVADMAYRERIRMMTMSNSRPVALMIDKREREHLYVYLARNQPHEMVSYQHGIIDQTDDKLFGLPIFWAEPSSMDGMAVRCLTDFTKKV
jgi:hypothetical protein